MNQLMCVAKNNDYLRSVCHFINEHDCVVNVLINVFCSSLLC